ncbi:exported hypothetical protein [uncultured Alphaproteobacteria bacterium]|uniref:Uncharacterized protein n=1 Tax=uncultured Alphaproteobacteria bacterium TaxID=91750 RepID=A0A212J6K1_9PROT|nr:exported hypothetical protein [uncultured Alphaproteobacteria bacterium]
MKRAALLAAAAVLLAAAPARANPPVADVFRTRSLVAHDLSAVPQWTDALERARAEAAALRAPRSGEACAGVSAAAWCAAVAAARPLPRGRQIYEINRFVNAMLGKAEDPGVPPAGERWPALTEALRGRGGGLAAAVVKYLSLREVGVPSEILRIVVVEDVLRGDRTALLLAREGSDEVVLSLDTDVLRGAARTANLRPYYSFNETTLWMHVPETQEISP